MTDYLQAYAHRVVACYPAAQRAEWYAEIYDELRAEYADWQDEHPGRGQVAFLQSMRPHPIRFATKLAAEDGPWLVGPAFYFSFVAALKTAMVIVIGLHVVLAAISVLLGGASVPGAALNMLTALPGTLLWVGACVLGVFVALEKSGEKASWLERWNASELEPVSDHQQISRFETVFDLALSTFVLLWLLDLVVIPFAAREGSEWDGAWVVNLPDAVWLAAGALLAWDIAFAVYRLGRTFWSRSLRLLTIAGNVLWLILLVYVTTLDHVLTAAQGAGQDLLPLAERALHGSLLVLCVIIAWDTARHAWRLVRTGD